MMVRVPGRDSIVSVPPRRLTRSSMPRRPMPRVRLGSKPEPSSSIFTLIELADCFKFDRDVFCVRVAIGVVERFLNHAIDAEFERVGEFVGDIFGADFDFGFAAARHFARVPFHSGNQAEIIEHRWAQQERHVAHGVHGALRDGLDAADDFLAFFVAGAELGREAAGIHQ